MGANAERILVFDAGTTSTRAMLFGSDGTLHRVAQRALTQHYPQPGWVEHDPEEIWQSTLACAREVVGDEAGRVVGIGIANQRETVVAWHKPSGRALANAIVWQDRRTADACAALRDAGHEADVQDVTGLLLNPYFSATKMRWLLDNVAAVTAAAREGTLAFGTIESWLVSRLSGGLHVSDASNASRTSLMGLRSGAWDEKLCALFGVPATALPEIVDCVGPIAKTLPAHFGAAIPITSLIGDQQAATIGQGCLSPGETKATYGTGAFVLANMGGKLPRSRHRLLGTVLVQLDGVRTYALEGSVFVAGSLVQWLRDGLGLLGSAAETGELAASVPDSGGVVIVPALSGLGAPHWRPDARGSITGLTFATTRAHLARAALEAMSFQTLDLAEAFAADGAAWRTLRIDGGMSANGWLAQDLSDMLALPVDRPKFIETTALGAAMLAGLGAGVFGSLREASASMRKGGDRFEPSMGDAERSMRIARWRRALQTA